VPPTLQELGIERLTVEDRLALAQGEIVSYEIAFYLPEDDRDDEEAGDHFFLSINVAWRDFSDWATALPGASYPALYQLCNDGEVTGTDALREDLKRALRSEPIPNPGIALTGKHLFRVIRRGNPEETAVVES